MNEPLAYNLHDTPVNAEDIVWEAAHEDGARNCPYLTSHSHGPFEGECPVNLRSILAVADHIGQPLRLGDMISTSALTEYDIATAMYGEDYAVQFALDSPWVRDQLRKRRRLRAAQQAQRLLVNCNHSMGVRFFESFVFPTFDPNTTFYVPCAPSLRVLGNITELRRVIAAGAATTEYNQTCEWLQFGSKAVFSSDELQVLFRIDTSDGYTGFNLDTIPRNYDLEGWAVIRGDDVNDDILYAIPRIYFKSDLAFREPQAYFVREDGQPEKHRTEHIDFNNIEARMLPLWEYNYIFRPLDSP